MERNEFRVAAALLAVVILAIGVIFYVRISGAESLRAAFADPDGFGEFEEFEKCYELYNRLGIWGYGPGRFATQDSHTETLPDGTSRTATLSIAFFDDGAAAGRSHSAQEAAVEDLRESDCFEAMEDVSGTEPVEPSVAAPAGIVWAGRVSYEYMEGDAERREIYIWLDGSRTATLDAWVDDTEAGKAFVREEYAAARTRVATSAPD